MEMRIVSLCTSVGPELHDEENDEGFDIQCQRPDHRSDDGWHKYMTDEGDVQVLWRGSGPFNLHTGSWRAELEEDEPIWVVHIADGGLHSIENIKTGERLEGTRDIDWKWLSEYCQTTDDAYDYVKGHIPILWPYRHVPQTRQIIKELFDYARFRDRR